MGKPLSGTWNHKRSWVQTIIGFLDTSFCDIRQIKISEQIYLSKPDIRKKKKNHLIIQVKYHTSKFFFCDVNLPDMYCYLIVRYQHLGFHIYFVRKMPLRLFFFKVNIKEKNLWTIRHKKNLFCPQYILSPSKDPSNYSNPTWASMSSTKLVEEKPTSLRLSS
jgi:hypothetical protein